MLYTLNAKERNLAFMQFIVSFLLTVALIVGAVYFPFRVPIKENEVLNEEIDKLHDEDMHQQKFVAQMNEVKVYLDSLKKSDTNAEQIELQLTQKMVALSNLQRTDNGVNGSMNQAITLAFAELQQAGKSLRELNAKVAKVNELERKLSACESDLDGYRRQNPQFGIQ